MLISEIRNIPLINGNSYQKQRFVLMLNLQTVPDTTRHRPCIDIHGLNYRISFLLRHFGC